MDAYEAAGEEAGRKLHKNVESSIKQVLATTPHETIYIYIYIYIYVCVCVCVCVCVRARVCVCVCNKC